MPKGNVTSRNAVVVLKAAAELDTKIRDASVRGMEAGLFAAVTVAQREFLSGPRPAKLDVRTRRLQQSIGSQIQVIEGKGAIGRIGTNVKYAAFHEFGFHGTQSVRGHTRVVAQLNENFEAIDTRRVLRDRSGNLIGYAESRKRSVRRQKAGIVVLQFVRAHERTIDYAGRPYIRPALDKTRPLILERIKAEIAKVTAPTTTGGPT
jgi:hypothetical protein